MLRKPSSILRCTQAEDHLKDPRKFPFCLTDLSTQESRRRVQWLRLRAPNAGGPRLIPGQGTRCYTSQLKVHKPQLKILRAETKMEDPTRRNQDPAQSNKINKSFLKKSLAGVALGVTRDHTLRRAEGCVCSTWDRNSPTRDLVSAPRIGEWSLTHRASGEVPVVFGLWVQQVPKGPGTTRATDRNPPSNLELSGSFSSSLHLHFQNRGRISGEG